MTFRKINLKKVCKSFIWISVLFALAAGLGIYKYGEDSWEVLNSNGKVYAEYIIRLALTILVVFLSFSIVFYLDLKRRKKINEFRNLVLILFISFILNILFCTALLTYIVFIGKLKSFSFIAGLFYLNQIAFTVGIFLYVFRGRLQSTVNCIGNTLKNLILIFLLLVIISIVLFYISGSEVRYDLIIIFTGIIISPYSAVFVPVQIRDLTEGRRDEDLI